ncbi:MAG: hypothetical protein MUE60_01555 [Candidatus Eisenbacteria bacterium]|nr:hypothetical protein [Candidatus Eisenbacteria bacterium]
MFQSTLRTRFAILAVVGILAIAASADIPPYVSYQGKVTDTSGNPVADGSYNMRFRIYDLSSGGTMLWDSGTRSIAVSGGVFNVLLGESPQPALTLDFSVDYWLLVTFSGADQTPRQRLTSNGYSYMASGVVPGTEVAGAVAASYVLKATNTATAGTGYGLYGQSASTAGFGVYGYATAGSGTTYGVCGVSNSTAGKGVYGGAGSGSGITCGVHGNSSSYDGRGVFGEATHVSGTNYGVFGTTSSPAGSGVYGRNLATTGSTEGVYGEVASPDGRGVYGLAYSGSGTTYGVHGQTFSTTSTAAGVFGEYGGISAADAIGVHGKSTSADYYGVGVLAEAGWKGVFASVSASGSGFFYGVEGHASTAEGAGTAYGVYGEAVGGANHYGVYYSGGIGGTSLMKNIVKTDEGPVALYAQVATENWFEDFGSGVVERGRADVRLASDFAKVASPAAAQFKVFITPNAQIGEWWVEKSGNGFTLHAPNATDGSSFDYRVVTKRPGSENLRLEAAPEGYMDRALYSSADDVPAEYRADWAKRAALESQSTDAR